MIENFPIVVIVFQRTSQVVPNRWPSASSRNKYGQQKLFVAEQEADEMGRECSHMVWNELVLPLGY